MCVWLWLHACSICCTALPGIPQIKGVWFLPRNWLSLSHTVWLCVSIAYWCGGTIKACIFVFWKVPSSHSTLGLTSYKFLSQAYQWPEQKNSHYCRKEFSKYKGCNWIVVLVLVVISFLSSVSSAEMAEPNKWKRSSHFMFEFFGICLLIFILGCLLAIAIQKPFYIIIQVTQSGRWSHV